MTFEDAQKEMSFSYFAGAPGVLVSGIIWCMAALMAVLYSKQASMLTLFFGGMLIHPMAMWLCKLLQRPGQHAPENPLGKLALESTIILFVGLFIAFYVARLQVDLFFPIMLLVIGVRYLIFHTLYGAKMYWLLGGVLMASGVICLLTQADFVVGALMGGGLEFVFALAIFNQSKKPVLKAKKQNS